MKKFFCLLVLSVLMAAAMISSGYCKDTELVRSVTKNHIDSVEITKITPRSLAYLPKPVKIPYVMEIKYALKSLPDAKLVVHFYRTNSGEKVKSLSLGEINKLRKTYNVKKGSNVFLHVSDPVEVGLDEKIKEVYAVVSLVNSKGQELAFSSSKNIIAGSFKIYPDKRAAENDKITYLNVTPKKRSEIKSNQVSKFEIDMEYSLKSRKIGYIDFLFMDVADLGTGRCWSAATIAVPPGRGKISVSPEIFFSSNLSGRNMGIGIIYWLDPLRTSWNYLKISDYFIK
ncbi:MAG: hypothetical protein LWY06_18010 [Firmicutes bacterium]|nr:hypothetical protein [Bacillota bacterium]